MQYIFITRQKDDFLYHQLSHYLLRLSEARTAGEKRFVTQNLRNLLK